jgi:thymidine phosphorylase
MTEHAADGRRGTLFLVVGPSGAGKDTLIAGARARLDADPRYLFAQRVITRPAEAGGEAHEPSTIAQFSAERAAGGFALAWSAHGLEYGIRRGITDELAAGRHVVANVSRAVIEEARRAFQPVIVIEVTAVPELLARRLAARGRESAEDIARRLARIVPVAGTDVRRIDNSGSAEEGVAALLRALA